MQNLFYVILKESTQAKENPKLLLFYIFEWYGSQMKPKGHDNRSNQLFIHTARALTT